MKKRRGFILKTKKMTNDEKTQSTMQRWKTELNKKGVAFSDDIGYEDLKALVFSSRTTKSVATQESAPASSDKFIPIEQVEKNVKAIVDAQTAEMRLQLAEMKKLLLQKGATPQAADNSVLVDALVKAMDKATTGRTTDMGLVNPDFVPPDDLLEIPETFYAVGGTFSIWGKKIGNVFTPVPLGLKFIRFQRAYGWSERNVNGNQQKVVSTFICWSKTISEFLKGLPEFGVQFHLSFTQALSSTREGDFIAAYSRQMNGLSNKTLGELTLLAKENGISTSIMYSLDDYRMELARKWANEEMNASKINFERGIQEVFKKDLLTGIAAHA